MVNFALTQHLFVLIIISCGLAHGQTAEDWANARSIQISYPSRTDSIRATSQKKNDNSRIVHGTQVPENYLKVWPFQAALLLVKPDGSYLCGGSLISANYILTAAHCTIDSLFITVRLGMSNMEVPGPEEVTQNTTDFYTNPHYNATIFTNDIAVIKLNTTVTFSDKIQPIRIPSHRDAGRSFAGYLAFVGGFGLTSDYTDTVSDRLELTAQRVITNRWCEELLGIIFPSTLCTQGTFINPLSGPCSGDSGGALAIPLDSNSRNLEYLQIGIVSFGPEDCSSGYPNAFTRVTSYLDFIAKNTDVKIKKSRPVNSFSK